MNKLGRIKITEEEKLLKRKRALEEAHTAREEKRNNFGPLIEILKEENIDLKEFASILQK